MTVLILIAENHQDDRGAPRSSHTADRSRRSRKSPRSSSFSRACDMMTQMFRIGTTKKQRACPRQPTCVLPSTKWIRQRKRHRHNPNLDTRMERHRVAYGYMVHMNYFQALEYFTDWPLVLAFVVIFSLATALLLTWSQSLIYRKRQEALTLRLRRRANPWLTQKPSLDAAGWSISWIEVNELKLSTDDVSISD